MGAGRANGLHKRRKPTRLVDGLIKGFFDLFHASIVDRKSINESATIYRMEKMSIHAINRSHRLRVKGFPLIHQGREKNFSKIDSFSFH